MTARRLVLAAGAVLLLVGVIWLLVPVSVSDGNGHSVGCGNGLVTDLSSARNANNNSVANIPILNQVVPHTDYVAECESAVGSRRTYTIPLVIVGILAVGGSLLVGRQGARRTGV